MVSHRAAIRAAAVATKIRQNQPSNPALAVPSKRVTPAEAPDPSIWLNPYPREPRQTVSPAPTLTTSEHVASKLPKPPSVEILDPSVFSHPSLAGDYKVFRFERPEEAQHKSDKRVGSFEKLELFGKSLLRMTLTQLVTERYASLTVPAIETLVNRLLSPSHLIILSDYYGLSSRLVADPLANKYLRLSPSVKTSLFYAYTAGIYQQEGHSYASGWIRQCFQDGLDQEYNSLRNQVYARKYAKAVDQATETSIEADKLVKAASLRKEEDHGQTRAESKLRNQNPVLPEMMPLVQLDAWIARNRLPAPIWSFSAKGVPPEETFRADLTIGDKTVQGSGQSLNRARQSAAAAYLGIKDLDTRLLDCALTTRSETNYTRVLNDYLRHAELPRPHYSTVAAPKSPHYECSLRVGSQTFVAQALGKAAARREASKLALEYFNNAAHDLERELFEYIRSHQYSISFSYSQIETLKATSLEEAGASEQDLWLCRVNVGGDSEGLTQREEIAEILGKGTNKILARRNAVAEAARMFGIDSSKTVGETDEQSPSEVTIEQVH